MSTLLDSRDVLMVLESCNRSLSARGCSGPPERSAHISELTAIVVTHNSARHLNRLGRALADSSAAPTRMVVVDNASVDDTVARARLAGFEVLETGCNDGFGAGCNAGLRATTTEFVLFCNPDVQPSPGALERLLTALNSTPTAAIAGAVLDDDANARRFSRITGNVFGFLPKRLQSRVRRFSQYLPIDRSKDQVVVDYAHGAFIVCRVAPLLAVGGFDERFFLYCEEEDLSRRLGSRGWLTLLVPSAEVRHEQSASSEGVDQAVMAPVRMQSLYWYYRKYHSRGYAELARCLVATCVLLDRAYRVLARRQQVYGPRTAIAAFRSTESIRRDHEGALG